MAEYDPFLRGVHPVGVRSATWNDAQRDREFPVEIWYPATPEFTGADLDPDRQDSYTAVWTAGGVSEPPPARQAAVRDAQAAALPGQLILFCHGYAGHRRESSFLCTHLASHGYVVVSADHTGSTGPEIDAAMAGQKNVDMSPRRHQMGLDRKLDVPFLVAEATRRGYASEGPVGVVGCSLGGFTALIAPAVERRVRSVVPLCPAGGLSPIYPRDNELSRHLDFDWPTGVSCLQGVADRDSWLPLYGQLGLFSRISGAKRMVILQDADHNHFCDDIAVAHEWFRELTLANAEYMGTSESDWPAIARAIPPLQELTAPDVTYQLWRGVTVAHFDATLRSSSAAADLLSNRLPAAARNFGARIITFTG